MCQRCLAIAIRNGSKVSRLYGVTFRICTLSCVYLSYYDFVSFAGLKHCSEWHDLQLADWLSYGKRKIIPISVNFFFCDYGQLFILIWGCSSPSLKFGPSWVWSNRDIPSRFVIKKLTRVRSETSYDPSKLPARVDRSQEQMKKGIRNVSVKYLISSIFPKNLHLKLYWLLQFEFRLKPRHQNFTTVPAWDSNRDFPIEPLVKVLAQDSIKLSPKLGVSKNSSSGLKQRLPKWDFGESASSKLNQTPPNPRFSNSFNSRLEQRIPK